MQKPNNAVCAICGNEYYICMKCNDLRSLNPWKLHTDTIEHYKIYQVIHGYSTGVYTKEEAKEKLKNIDLSDINNLRDNIKSTIFDIMNDNDNFKTENTSDEILSDNAKKKITSQLKSNSKKKSDKIITTEIKDERREKI